MVWNAPRRNQTQAKLQEGVMKATFKYIATETYIIHDVEVDPNNPTQPLDGHDITDNLDMPDEVDGEIEIVVPTAPARLTFLDDCHKCQGVGEAGGCPACGAFL